MRKKTCVSKALFTPPIRRGLHPDSPCSPGVTVSKNPGGRYTTNDLQVALWASERKTRYFHLSRSLKKLDLLAEGTKSQESRIDSLTSASVHLVYMSTKRYLERSGAEEGLVKSGPRYCLKRE